MERPWRPRRQVLSTGPKSNSASGRNSTIIASGNSAGSPMPGRSVRRAWTRAVHGADGGPRSGRHRPDGLRRGQRNACLRHPIIPFAGTTSRACSIDCKAPGSAWERPQVISALRESTGGCRSKAGLISSGFAALMPGVPLGSGGQREGGCNSRRQSVCPRRRPGRKEGR